MKKKNVIKISILLIMCILVVSYMYSINRPKHVTLFDQNSIEESATILENDSHIKNDNVPVTYFWGDVQENDNEEIIDYLNDTGVKRITIPIAWSQVEPERGVWTFEKIDNELKKYVAEDFEFIFVLDTGSRYVTDEIGNILWNSVPEWVWEETDATTLKYFTETGRKCFDIADISNTDIIIEEFYKPVIKHFKEMYGEKIIGFAPGIMWEFEVKMPQEGFCWASYSPTSEKLFKDYLLNEYGDSSKMNQVLGTAYKDISEIAEPVINYNNSITAGQLVDAPLYKDFMEFREEQLASFVKPLFAGIRECNTNAVSYFAQTLHAHDGIYAAGVVQKLAEDVDIAVIDYNFYDGYTVVEDAIIPAALTNYLKNLGYSKVYTGVYLERLDAKKYQDMIQQTINYASADGYTDGFEIGGLQDKSVDLTFSATKRTEKSSVAIYVSEWNFYKSHGEYPEYINYFTDVIMQMYKIIQFELGIDVDIISDKAVLDGAINNYKVVVLPSQFYVESDVKQAICDYANKGGSLLQDFRFGEWDEYGNNTGDWGDDVFGITAKESIINSTVLNSTSNLDIPSKSNAYKIADSIPSCYAIAGKENASYLYSNGNKYYGLKNDNTVLLGWQPQLLYKYAKTKGDRKCAVDTIKKSLDYLMQIK